MRYSADFAGAYLIGSEMASITLQDVCVEFAVPGADNKSLKGHLARAGVGGLITRDGKNLAKVSSLKDISLQLGSGDRLALIGHNGAGKSTLLRVMGGVYEPCRGSLRIEGRVSAVFDPSLGMSPELNGYDNIMLRGIYLGFSPRDIRPRIDDIAEFSGLGEFLTLPLSSYSSGMRARLAFAISTSFTPEILLLDEGFGTADAAFTAKAEERMNRFLGQANIIVLASHTDDLLKRICNKAILMEHGSIVAFGAVDDMLERYHSSLADFAN